MTIKEAIASLKIDAEHVAFDTAEVDLPEPAKRFIEAVRVVTDALETTRDWTPCADGLPEESGRYIVTVKRTVLGKETEFTSERDFYAYLSAGHKWESTGIVDENIIAWMPKFKPAPYRADDTTGKVKED